MLQIAMCCRVDQWADGQMGGWTFGRDSVWRANDSEWTPLSRLEPNAERQSTEAAAILVVAVAIGSGDR